MEIIYKGIDDKLLAVLTGLASDIEKFLKVGAILQEVGGKEANGGNCGDCGNCENCGNCSSGCA